MNDDNDTQKLLREIRDELQDVKVWIPSAVDLEGVEDLLRQQVDLLEQIRDALRAPSAS
jgi:hypothetical protein